MSRPPHFVLPESMKNIQSAKENMALFYRGLDRSIALAETSRKIREIPTSDHETLCGMAILIQRLHQLALHIAVKINEDIDPLREAGLNMGRWGEVINVYDEIHELINIGDKLEYKLNQKASRQERVFGRIRSLHVEKANREDLGNTCAICLEDFKEGEYLIRLPCAHKYHFDCVSTWLFGNPSCPVDLRSIME